MISNISSKRPVNIRHGTNTCSNLAHRSGVDVRYLRPKSEHAVSWNYLDAQGQWLVRVGDKFLGFTSGGVRWETKAGWVALLLKSMTDQLKAKLAISESMPTTPSNMATGARLNLMGRLINNCWQDVDNWKLHQPVDLDGKFGYN